MKYIPILILILFACQENIPIQVEENSSFEFQNGDIIFQTSLSHQSKAIQLATNSPYSHVGIVYLIANEIYVYEAIQPVKLTKLKTWINRGENEEYVVKRLKDGEQILTSDRLMKMQNVGQQYLNKDYDLYFEWSDDRIYCSELVWKIYKEALGIELGKLEKIADFDLSSSIVKEKMQERYQGNIPMDEKVISPDAIYKSELLETVFKD